MLRSEVTPNKEFNPRAFDIYGPKIIATRHEFQDEALESRCLTSELDNRKLRGDIPISLPKAFSQEAQELRNKLLKYRLDRFSRLDEPPLVSEVADLPPRRAQIIAPLLRIAISSEAKKRIIQFVSSAKLANASSHVETENRLLQSIKRLLATAPNALPLAMVAKAFTFCAGIGWGRFLAKKVPDGLITARRWVVRRQSRALVGVGLYFDWFSVTVESPVPESWAHGKSPFLRVLGRL